MTTEKEQKALILRESYGLTVQETALIERGLALAESIDKKEYTWPIIGAKFVLIPAGTFMMGSPEDEIGHRDDETLHEVTISKPFYLQTTTVTQLQWEVLMGTNPGGFMFPFYHEPVNWVTWDDTQEFVSKLNSQSGKNYRLPTEAEWEYACRAGSTGKYCFGDDENMLFQYAWYYFKYHMSNQFSRSGGRKRPNDWGLYDMHGNIWEWVQDWYGDYPSSSVTDPEGPSSGSERVLRGGGIMYYASVQRSAERHRECPDLRALGHSFRVAISASEFSKSIELKTDDADGYAKLNPQDADAYINRGIAYNDLGNYQQAIKDYNKAIELNPQDEYAYYNRGNAYGNLGNYQQAISDYNKAIELSPQDEYTFNKRGIAYEKIGNTQQAIEDYKIAARLGNKGSQDILRSRGIEW